MPGFYGDGEYDLAGFIVGVVDRERLINGRTIAVGDVLVGVPSSGLHTNGYSLARRIAFDQLGLRVDSHVPELGTYARRGIPRTAPVVPAAGAPPAGRRPHQGDGAHHRRRHYREPAARASARHRGGGGRRRRGRYRRCSGGCQERARAGGRHDADLQHGHRPHHRHGARQGGAVDRGTGGARWSRCPGDRRDRAGRAAVGQLHSNLS